MEILTGIDSKQLGYCASLHDHNFPVHEERYLNDSFGLRMGFSIRQSAVKAVTKANMARMLFRGDKPEWPIVTLRKDLVTAPENMKALTSLLPKLDCIDMLVLDPSDGALFDEGLSGTDPEEVIFEEPIMQDSLIAVVTQPPSRRSGPSSARRPMNLKTGASN